MLSEAGVTSNLDRPDAAAGRRAARATRSAGQERAPG